MKLLMKPQTILLSDDDQYLHMNLHIEIIASVRLDVCAYSYLFKQKQWDDQESLLKRKRSLKLSNASVTKLDIGHQCT